MTDRIKMFIAPPPEGAEAGCCSVLEGRCEPHGAMMTAIRKVWEDGTQAEFEAILGNCDGYGETGFNPDLDWSGVRDSSTFAVEAMYNAVCESAVLG